MQTNTLKYVLVAITGIFFFSACTTTAADEKQSISTTAVTALPVDVEVAVETPLHQVETVAGSVIPNRVVDVMSEVSRKVVAVYFTDGSHVNKGQVLYKLDDAEIQAKLRQLAAELNLARISERRLSELLKTETVRQEEYDIAWAKLQSLQAAEDILRVELSKTLVRAPFAGIAGISKAYSGTFVSPGLPLVSLQEQSILKIQFNVSEKYLSLFKVGDKVEFSTELDSKKLAATVVSSEASVDLLSRNLTIQASVPNADGRLKAGISAKVYFNSADRDATGIMVSTEALIPGGGGYSVFVVKNGCAKSVPVSVANRNDREAQISSGIGSGDTILISNLLRVAEGMPVSIATIH